MLVVELAERHAHRRHASRSFVQYFAARAQEGAGSEGGKGILVVDLCCILSQGPRRKGVSGRKRHTSRRIVQHFKARGQEGAGVQEGKGIPVVELCRFLQPGNKKERVLREEKAY
jgi:predicted secreted protein